MHASGSLVWLPRACPYSAHSVYPSSSRPTRVYTCGLTMLPRSEATERAVSKAQQTRAFLAGFDPPGTPCAHGTRSGDL